MRAREIKKANNGGNSFTEALRAHPNVKVRHFVQEQDGASGTKEISYDPSVTWPLQTKGRLDA